MKDKVHSAWNPAWGLREPWTGLGSCGVGLGKWMCRIAVCGLEGGPNGQGSVVQANSGGWSVAADNCISNVS